ncbi:hypothetical protein VHEMI08017 [[Torrubiella] hemipterigena]|uniref:EKC/KEOPS complex subunit GON7 n=1 Tax=[Torrubiella] hemipterigena TaxID=1531966 RepID=A0A0A1T5C0_9HYPO|nr:hypothetical protein VHEMI08017 [[Torrubiella] hemipterigena]
MAAENTTPSLTATYSSPTNEAFTTSTPLPASASTTAEKTAFLTALREAVTKTQAEINKELTARMEEDNARNNTSSAADDAKDEENYGEEVVEEEE